MQNNVLDRFDLSGKVILLTGGSGLYGRGLTADLASAGATLIIASRNLANLEAVACEETAKGHTVIAEQYDQGSDASIAVLLQSIVERYGRIDGLVNNSVIRPMGSAPSLAEGLETSMQINATGVILMHQHFAAQMASQGEGGSIVNIGSMQGMIGPNFSLYKGTDMPPPPPDYFFHKGGMINLSKYYAGLYGAQGVRVNCLSPGGFFTQQPEPFLSNYTAQTYLKRMADPEDLGGAVIFLLSAAAKYITGVNLPIDGGYTAM